ncbi:MAG: CDGSH iron-sulfur domain-containing protein [Gemmatimonadaceae bacterium]|nr:CDGSH iron-sulfur domain-containing protein [Gemmatimonadaceae bacterium]
MPPFTIRVRENASLFIAPEDAAQLKLLDHTGNEIPIPPGKGVSLCRCGASRRKPFCDASHKQIAWDGTLNPTGPVATAPPAPSASTPAPSSPVTPAAPTPPTATDPPSAS